MALKDEIPLLIAEYKKHKDTFAHNAELFEIFEGDLLTHLMTELKGQFSEKSFLAVSKRVAPINVLKRLIDKLSKIYAKPPVRKVTDGTEQDDELLGKFADTLSINTTMGATDGANGLFNLFKNTFIEPFLDRGKPGIRVLPSDRFFVLSLDAVNPMRVTHYCKVMGTFKDIEGGEKVLFYAYTEDEFIAFDSDEKIRVDKMTEAGNPTGVNPLGKIPGVYICRSKYNLIPKIDSDTLRMTKLIPVLLSDLNYALMFQCFSVMYTIDADQTGLVQAPNALWDIKTAPGSDKAAQIGTVKPEVDSDKALAMIKSLLAMWMQTRNIKPGAMGDMTVENAASAIAKVVDEMDTSEDRSHQVPYFVKAETELWDLLLNHFHPEWSKDQTYEFKSESFKPGAKVGVTFAEQRPIIDSSKAIADQKGKMELGLQTRKGALKELHPDWDEKQIMERLKEVDAEAKERQARAQEHGDQTEQGKPQKGKPEPKPEARA